MSSSFLAVGTCNAYDNAVLWINNMTGRAYRPLNKAGRASAAGQSTTAEALSRSLGNGGIKSHAGTLRVA